MFLDDCELYPAARLDGPARRTHLPVPPSLARIYWDEPKEMEGWGWQRVDHPDGCPGSSSAGEPLCEATAAE